MLGRVRSDQPFCSSSVPVIREGWGAYRGRLRQESLPVLADRRARRAAFRATSHGTQSMVARSDLAGLHGARGYSLTSVRLLALRQVVRVYPRRKLHIVVGQLRYPQAPAVRAWLAKNPRITLHFTPTLGFWLNRDLLSIITRQGIRRGSFTPLRSSSPRSRPSSMGGTTAASPFPGPRPLTLTSYSRTAAPVKNHVHATLGGQVGDKRLYVIDGFCQRRYTSDPRRDPP